MIRRCACRSSSPRTAATRRAATFAPPAGSPAVKDIKIIPVDYDYIEKESGRIKRRFNEIFQ